MAGSLQAQDEWSFERCLLYALENNIQIKQQELKVEYSENNLKQAKADMLPNLNAGASQDFRFGRSVDPLTYEFTNKNNRGSFFQTNSMVNLFNGLQTINNISKNKLNLKKNFEELKKAKNDLSLNIARAYLQILFNIELYDIAQNQCKITEQQVKQTRKLVDAGSLTRGNLLEILAQLSAEELVLINVENQLNLSYLDLSQILDLKTADNFRILIPVFNDIADERIIFTLLDVYDKALALLPQIIGAEYELMASKKDLSIAKGKLSPSLSLGGSLSTGYSDNITVPGTDTPMSFVDQMDFSQNKTFGFNLRIPVFNRFASKINISNSRIKVLQSEYNLQIEKNILFNEIQQAFSDARAALKKYNASQTTVKSIEESFDYTRQMYDLGMVNTVDFNIAKNNLAKVRSDLLQAKYNYIFNIKILDFYRGNPITL